MHKHGSRGVPFALDVERGGRMVRGEGTRNVLMLLLAIVGAGVDALSYLGLQQVFTANQTGNLVLFGLAAARMDAAAAGRAGLAVATFVLGVAVVAFLERRLNAVHRPWPRSVTLSLWIELAALTAAAALWIRAGEGYGTLTGHLLIALLSLAMGIQSNAVTSLGVRGVVTTYVTGTITAAVSDLVHRRDADGRRVRLAMLAVYLAGAFASGLLYLRVGPWAAVLPPAAVALVAAAGALVRWEERHRDAG